MTLEDDARLTRLENHVRVMKAGATGAILLAILAFTIGWTPDDGVLEAKRFVLLDENGRQAAILGTDAELGTCLRFLGPTEDSTLVLGITPKGDPELALHRSATATAKASLTCTAGGSAYLRVYGDNPRGGVLVQFRSGEYCQVHMTSPDDSSELGLAAAPKTISIGGRGPKGTGFGLFARDTREVGLQFLDSEKRDRVKLGLPPQGEATMELRDAEGKAIWEAGGK